MASQHAMKTVTAVLLSLLCGTTAFRLTIEPYSQVISDRDNVTVLCKASEELSDCQFSWWDLDDDGLPISKFDFHLGTESETAYLVNGSETNWRLAGYRYVGDGLKAGQCGIQLFGLMVRYRMVSCRARLLGTGWKYAYMTIRGNVTTELEFDPKEQMAVVLPRNNLTILSWTDSPIRSCTFRFNGQDPICFGSNINMVNKSHDNNRRRGNNTNSRVQGAAARVSMPCAEGPRSSTRGKWPWSYYGSSPANNQCGIQIQVTSELNGLVYFEAWTESGGYDRRVFHLTVVEPPVNLFLNVPKTEVLENEVFYATCNVSLSRPVANITWYIGDTLLREDPLDDSSSENHNDSPWRWAHGMYPLTQTMILSAKREWNGKQIQCIVSHVGLSSPFVLTKLISVAAVETRVTCIPVSPAAGVVESCTLGNRPVNCSIPAQWGTVLTMTSQRANGRPMTSIMTCLNTGAWERNDSATSRDTCPPVPPTNGVQQECWIESRIVDCAGPARLGTVLKVTSRCRGGASPVQSILTCMRTGEWDKLPLKCQSYSAASRDTCPTVPPTNGVQQECWIESRRVNCARPARLGTVLKMTSWCSDGTPRAQRILTCMRTGEWDKSPLKCLPDSATSRDTCPTVPPTNGVQQLCRIASRPVDCAGPARLGTELKMTSRCGNGAPPAQSILTCLSTGEWDKPPLKCLQGCGTSVQISSSEQPLVHGQFPWQVAIYKLQEGKYEQVCSGTLLSMKTIITAATCYAKDMRGIRSFNASLYKVAAAKLSRSWELDDEFVQKRNVASLVANQYFTGESNNFNSNYALLKVTEPFVHTNDVSPVCVDWNLSLDRQRQFLLQKVGHVPGWGFVEEEHQGAVLKAVALPHVEYEECSKLLEPAVSLLLSGDTFCAGSTNHYLGYTVCDTDQGAGIVFLDPNDGKYYLHGVASVTLKPLANDETCYPSSLVNFGTFHLLKEWVQENIS